MLPASSRASVRRILLLAMADLTAWLVLAAGLIAPLTPSHGSPSALVLVVFAGMPVAILIACLRASRSRLAAVFFGLQLLALVGLWGVIP